MKQQRQQQLAQQLREQKQREQEKLKQEQLLQQQQGQSEEEQKQQQGEETAQGRSREQAAGESAGEESESPAAATTSGDGNSPESAENVPPTAATSTATPSDDAMIEDVVGAEDGVSMVEAPSVEEVTGEAEKQVEGLENMGAETGTGVVRSSKALEKKRQAGKELKQEQVEESGGKQEQKKEQGRGHDEQGEKGGEEGLPVLLLRELASFRARFPHRVGKHLRADASEHFLKYQVRVLVSFWRGMT